MPLQSLILPQLLSVSLFLSALSLSLLPSSSSSSSATSSPSSSFYDVLRSHGLPIGLFPKGVQNFSVDAATGRFHVSLGRSCSAKFENQVHYDFNVSGTLSFGQIGAISGLTAQELFLWFPVKGINVDIPSSGLIHFDVGVVRKQFSLSLFEIPPDCTDEPPPDMLYRDARFFPRTQLQGPSVLKLNPGRPNMLRAVHSVQ